jgi:hypothetical protein
VDGELRFIDPDFACRGRSSGFYRAFQRSDAQRVIYSGYGVAGSAFKKVDPLSDWIALTRIQEETVEKPNNNSDEDEPHWWSETEICREFCRPHAESRAKVKSLGNQAGERANVPAGEGKGAQTIPESSTGKGNHLCRGIIRALFRRLRWCGILA